MRLLVLDGSRVLPSVVARLVPKGVEVESARSFAQASQRLRERPPQALIVNVSPSALPWQELQRLCSQHDPPIPVLFESCVYRDALEAGLEQLDSGGHFLEKPYSIADLRREVEWLLHRAETRSREASPKPDGDAPVH